jgi:hypothetical protein
MVNFRCRCDLSRFSPRLDLGLFQQYLVEPAVRGNAALCLLWKGEPDCRRTWLAQPFRTRLGLRSVVRCSRF